MNSSEIIFQINFIFRKTEPKLAVIFQFLQLDPAFLPSYSLGLAV